MITAAQLRAARGLLDWTRADLAKAANISPETVKNIEHGTFRPQENTADAIVKAFQGQNVKFTENEGVQMSKELIHTFSGKKGYEDFLDDICQTMRSGGKTRQFNFSDKIITSYGVDKIEKYSMFLAAIPNLDSKCLVPEGDQIFPVKHCEYKWLRSIYRNAIPYYLYGNKIAMMASGPEEDIIFVSITSDSLARAYQNLFDIYWNEGVLPHPPTKAT